MILDRWALAVLLASACGGGSGGGRDGDGGPGDGQGDGGGDGSGGADGGGAPISTPVMPLLDGDAFYPRALELDDGTILAAVVAPQPSGRLGGTVLASDDEGVTFDVIGAIDGEHAAGGLCCATLYRLPRALGALPAGSILWSASVGGDNPDAPMSIPVFASSDGGASWSFLSNVTIAGVPRAQGGLWEPEFEQLDDGSLVCHYSDETDPDHSQKLVARRSTDGVTWSAARDTVSMAPFGARPGMPVVRRAPDGRHAMSFEICGTDGCATHLRFSVDGWDWGNAADPALRPAMLGGLHFRHAPTLAVSDRPGANGRFYLVGQMLTDPGGAPSANNGRVLLASSEGGGGTWYPIAAPVPVPDATDNFCPNYSSAILPLDRGRVVLEIASAWEDGHCRTFFARGPLGGRRGDALEDGVGYVLRSLQSAFCLDVVDGSGAPGANIRQWDCNGSGAQHFATDPQPDGSVRLINVGSGLCVGAAGDSGQAGANVEQVACDNATRWRIESVGVDHVRVVHDGTEVCLDVAGGSTEMGANVQQWTCNDLSPQIWRAEP
ncbi:MAG TPA: RICIN domain-containing protein [Kofleriaceae bacterium]|jgi:hypothetical protein